MKKLLPLLLITTCSIFSCSKKEVVQPLQEITIGPGGHYIGDENISNPQYSQPQDAIVLITQVDTIVLNKVPGGTVLVDSYYTGAYVDTGDTAIVNINIKGKGTYERKFSKAWDGIKNKWTNVHQIKFNLVNGVDVDITTNTIIQKTGESKTTNTKFKVNTETQRYDLLRANFGDSQSKVITDATKYSHAVITTISPNTITVNGVLHSFKENKLTHIYWYNPNYGGYQIHDFKRLGYTGDTIPDLGAKWKVGNLTMSYELVSLETSLNTFTEHKAIVATK